MKTLALDADDTLWENIDFFLKAQSGLCELLKDYVPASEVESHMLQERNTCQVMCGRSCAMQIGRAHV